MAVLERIRSENTLSMAVRTIGEYLTGSGLVPGDKLPTEAELSRKLGVSRTILREALRHYRTLGIISARPRLGMTVERLLPDDPYREYLPFIAAAPGALDEVAELRLCLESGAAELILARATADDMAELRRIVDKMRIAPARELDRLDIDFHSHLLRITGNRMIGTLIPLLIEFFRIQRSTPRATARGSNADGHLRLVEALEAGDAAKFRKLVSQHIMPTKTHHKEDDRI